MQEQNNNPSLPQKSGVVEILGGLLILLGILLFLSLYSFQDQISQGQEPIAEYNLIGTFGHYWAEMLFLIFGKSSFLLGPYLVLLGFLTIPRGVFSDPLSRLTAIFIMMLGSSILGAMLYAEDRVPSQIIGGLFGARLANFLQKIFGVYGSEILAGGILIGGLFLAVRMPFALFLKHIQQFIAKLLYYYSRLFTMENYSSVPISPPAPEPALTNSEVSPNSEKTIMPNIQFIQRERDSENRPWIEKVGVGDGSYNVQDRNPDKDAKASMVPTPKKEESNPYAPVIPNRPDFTMSRTSDSTRNLHSTLKQMNQRLSSNTISNSEPLQALKEQGYFTGRFNADHSRFHFRSGSHNANSLFGFTYDDDDMKRNVHSNENDAHGNASISLPQSKEKTMLSVGLYSLQKPEFACAKEKDISTANTKNSEIEMQDLSPLVQKNRGLEHKPKQEISQVKPQDLQEHEEEPVTETTIGNDDIRTESIAMDDYPDPYDKVRSSGMTHTQNFPKKDTQNPEIDTGVPALPNSFEEYKLSTDILHKAQEIPSDNIFQEIKEVREKLPVVMQQHGIQARVVASQRGPIITLYEMKLEPGIKVSRVLSLEKEICMHLAVPIVRIIAPIPGKSTIGIEVPNHIREPVLLGQLLPMEQQDENMLKIVLGKDISGEGQYTELNRLPHLLIAGATGAGKSVYLNAVIASLLYQSSPENVRFVMIDPKMVELKLYEGIPHLLMPVITDVFEASKALRWLIDEMERRYELLSHLRCRDICSYNERMQKRTAQHASDEKSRRMPYIVILIDELSDLMMIAAKDVEDSIIRLTQKARAVGMHIIMATQRPSVDVITALIKANCPARVAFQVAQRTDSRTILDANGAENLIGRGDFLYKSPQTTTLKRIQAPFVSEEEIEAMVNQAKSYGEAVYVDLEAENGQKSQFTEEIDEDLFEQALDIVLESGKTSTSHLQRRMRIGYNRAANLIEMMEERGYLSPSLGNKPREILRSRVASEGP